jgi:hypothetical protein
MWEKSRKEVYLNIDDCSDDAAD